MTVGLGKTHPSAPGVAPAARTEVQRHRSMTWAQRLKRVFAIAIDTCRRCGGTLRVIASIQEPQVIERILEHLARDRQSLDPAHPSRAPPHARLPIRSNAIRAKHFHGQVRPRPAQCARSVGVSCHAGEIRRDDRTPLAGNDRKTQCAPSYALIDPLSRSNTPAIGPLKLLSLQTFAMFWKTIFHLESVSHLYKKQV